jgi:hypothetical protein
VVHQLVPGEQAARVAGEEQQQARMRAIEKTISIC